MPLLGSMDNSTSSWIEEPWSPEITSDKVNNEGAQPGSPLKNWKHRNSPGELPITVRAYAGPMSPSKVVIGTYSPLQVVYIKYNAECRWHVT